MHGAHLISDSTLTSLLATAREMNREKSVCPRQCSSGNNRNKPQHVSAQTNRSARTRFEKLRALRLFASWNMAEGVTILLLTIIIVFYYYTAWPKHRQTLPGTADTALLSTKQNTSDTLPQHITDCYKTSHHTYQLQDLDLHQRVVVVSRLVLNHLHCEFLLGAHILTLDNLQDRREKSGRVARKQ